MSKHTNGPWVAVGVDTQKHGQDLTIEARTLVHGNPHYIGRVYGPGILARMDDETRANARLVAASPDLLKACSMALEVFRRHGLESYCGEDELTDPTA